MCLQNEKRVIRTYGIRHDCWHSLKKKFEVHFLQFHDAISMTPRSQEIMNHIFTTIQILWFSISTSDILGVFHLRHCVRGGLHSDIRNRMCLPSLLYCGEWIFYKDILLATNLYFSFCIRSYHVIGAIKPLTSVAGHLKHPDDHVTSLQSLRFSFRNKYIICQDKMASHLQTALENYFFNHGKNAIFWFTYHRNVTVFPNNRGAASK